MFKKKGNIKTIIKKQFLYTNAELLKLKKSLWSVLKTKYRRYRRNKKCFIIEFSKSANFLSNWIWELKTKNMLETFFLSGLWPPTSYMWKTMSLYSNSILMMAVVWTRVCRMSWNFNLFHAIMPTCVPSIISSSFRSQSIDCIFVGIPSIRLLPIFPNFKSKNFGT